MREIRAVPEYWLNLAPLLGDRYRAPRNPETRERETVSSLQRLYTEECAKIELLADKYGILEKIEIPGEVMARYESYRPTSLFRVRHFERALQYEGQIFCKSEAANPGGSHKPNTAYPQAFYAAQQGLGALVTDTGAGQWGTALALASRAFGLECVVFMTHSSYVSKPYRRTMMEMAGAKVYSSPSAMTLRGRNLLEAEGEHSGSLGIGMGEAIELVRTQPGSRLALGCMAYHAALHQSVIGIEADAQLARIGVVPDVLVACVGGGSNLIGFAAPFLRRKLRGESEVRVVCAESASAPAMTKGELRYDFADAFGYTSEFFMYTLGHEFVPPAMHAGGLRYHGKSTILSTLAKERLVEAIDIPQEEAFAAARRFYMYEGVLPAPESGHAIAGVERIVAQAKAEGAKPTIAFCLSGNGYLDIEGYRDQLCV